MKRIVKRADDSGHAIRLQCGKVKQTAAKPIFDRENVTRDLRTDTGKILKGVNRKRNVKTGRFTDGLSGVLCFHFGKFTLAATQGICNSPHDGRALMRVRRTPSVFKRAPRAAAGKVNLFSTCRGDLTEVFAVGGIIALDIFS